MTTVAASVPVLRWAAQRARLHDGDLAARFHKWPLWLSGEAQPTLKQLETSCTSRTRPLAISSCPSRPRWRSAAAINTFLQAADFYLLARALAGNHVLVTREVPSNSLGRIKVPNACVGLGVRFMTPYQMLRIEQARFVLGAHE